MVWKNYNKDQIYKILYSWYKYITYRPYTNFRITPTIKDPYYGVFDNTIGKKGVEPSISALSEQRLYHLGYFPTMYCMDLKGFEPS